MDKIVFPNAKEKEPYTYTIEWGKFALSNIGDHHFEGLEAIGLAYDSVKGMVHGIPSKPGDADITLFYKPADSLLDQPLTRPVHLFINFDPRSLWTEHEPPPDAPYQKSHTETKRDASGSKTIIGASKRGRSHARESKFRDDDFDAIYRADTGWYVITVADGAGSAKFSREGSRIATDTVVEHLSLTDTNTRLDELEALIAQFEANPGDANRKAIGDTLYNTVGNAVFLAYKNIAKEAENTQNLVKDYATTLLVTVCRQFANKWFIGAFG
ncbi:protein phosphatase 2C domain-containing protein [Paraflavitalea speifideaquila]|uniref:protein phosphatase 2C domain-containing protein n=1 Tax=Paraflavitalea speifideaquila TaxID=3076558 RepID=UPI0028E239CC|nr:protein phosphatase 2C domain-containing protein [Paraflavitalea speifideiaquila]